MRPRARSALSGFSGVSTVDRLVERFEDAMRRDDRRLKHVVLVGDVANRLEQRLRILDEGDERAEREHSLPGVFCITRSAAVPDDERDADRADEIDERERRPRSKRSCRCSRCGIRR